MLGKMQALVVVEMQRLVLRGMERLVAGMAQNLGLEGLQNLVVGELLIAPKRWIQKTQ